MRLILKDKNTLYNIINEFSKYKNGTEVLWG